MQVFDQPGETGGVSEWGHYLKMLANEEPNRENLLRSIRPGAQLDHSFFLKIYGYAITTPEFAKVALQRMEILGCNGVSDYYNSLVAEYEQKTDRQLREVGAWYMKQQGPSGKDGDERWILQKITQDLQRKSDRELLNLLQRLS